MRQKSDRSLRGIPLLDGVEESFLHDLEACCLWKQFRAHQQIVSHLDGSDDVFFLLSGSARVIIYSASGKAIAFRDIEPGDIFGEFAAIDGNLRSASVEGLKDGMVVQLPASCFWDALAQQPEFMRAVVKHLVRQVRMLTGRIFEFSTLAVNNRIHAELLKIAKPAGDNPDRAHISRMPTHAEFASRISTHREAVTRELSRLEQLGLIARRGSALVITDFPRLGRMVREATGE